MSVTVDLLPLIGVGSEYDINLGTNEIQEYNLIVPDDFDPNIILNIHIENGSFKFQSNGKSIKKVTVRSTQPVKYGGGLSIEELILYAPQSKSINLKLQDVSHAESHPYDFNYPDLDYVKEHLTGVCFGHGTGDLSQTATSLDELRNDLPHVNSLNYIVAKSGSSTKAGECIIYDSLNGYKDDELLASFQTAKEKGFNICFTPTLLMQDGSWRGFINGSSADIGNFYTNQYQPYILHYANLLKDIGLESFSLGSELEKLNNNGFVDYLLDLAEQVKAILPTTKITYTANWTEYHHGDGGSRPLDPLWASSNIDFVGINPFFPLTNLTNSTLSSGDIVAALGTPNEYGPDWDYKCVEHWTQTIRWDNGVQTGWKINMKPVRFMGLGLQSVVRITDQPYEYYGGGSERPISYDHMIKGYSGYLQKFQGSLVVESIYAHFWNVGGKTAPKDPSYSYNFNIEGKILNTNQDYHITLK